MSDGKLQRFEYEFTLRLLDMAGDCHQRGVPPDAVVRALLGAGLSFARRFDTGASIALQLEPVMAALADDAGPVLPLVQ